MNQREDLMMGAPSEVLPKRLHELHVRMVNSMRSLLECFDVDQSPIKSSYPDIYLGFVFRPTLSNKIGQ
jgi:hypothetical protein